jgi:hypothetical protein
VFAELAAVVSDHDEAEREGEIFLPDVVAAMVASGAAVRVLPSDETCLSLTYQEDLDAMRSAQ